MRGQLGRQQLGVVTGVSAVVPRPALVGSSAGRRAAGGCAWRRAGTAAVASPAAPASSSDAASRGADAAELSAAATTVAVPAAAAFVALGVDPLLAAALPSLGVRRPSPIQSSALPAILTGANCALQSYTGSGKTLSYLLPILTLALARARHMEDSPTTPRRAGLPDIPIQVLVVAPTQELAMQIVRVARSLLAPALGSPTSGAVQQVIGGANPKRQAEALAAAPGPLLVVGTPGRLSEMVRTGALRLHMCPIMVLDEADQLLAPAFAEDINHLHEHCGKRLRPKPSDASPAATPLDASQHDGSAPSPPALSAPSTSGRQTVLVSATLRPSTLSRAARWCPDPRFVSAGAVPALAQLQEAGPSGAAAEAPAWGWGARGWDGPASPLGPRTRGSAGGVEADALVPTMPPRLQHYYVVAEPRHKVDVLRRAMHALSAQRVLVFMNFQQRLKDAAFKLQARGIKAGALHGELPRLVRANLLNDFCRGRLRALIVSDVAARGIDVPTCDAVFHLELPSSAAHYAHRAGRTGRLSAALAAAEAGAAEAARRAAEEAGAQALAEGGDAAGAEAQQGASAPAAVSAAAEAEESLEQELQQAAGTVVTIVAPSERFVVDKLAEQLGVPLMEAHLAHGELRLGAPPAGYSFERDGEERAKADTSEDKKGAKPARRERKGDEARGEGGGGVQRDAGAEASTSGRAGAAASPADAAQPKRRVAGQSADATPKRASAAPGSTRAAAPPASGAAAAGKGEAFPDADDAVLDDDSDSEDDEVLDEDLATFKSLRGAQIRALRSSNPADSGGAAAGLPQHKPRARKEGPEDAAVAAKRAAKRKTVMDELQRELEELRAEKDAAKKQQQQQQRGGWDVRP